MNHRKELSGKTLHCFFDGATEPVNPYGNMGIGCFIHVAGDNGARRIFEHSDYIPASRENSNNVAEYMALVKILEFIFDHDLDDLPCIIKGDSMLVIKQMNGQWRVKNGLYVPHAKKALDIAGKFVRRPRFIWIPREQNSIADELSKVEMIKNNCEFRIQPEGFVRKNPKPVQEKLQFETVVADISSHSLFGDIKPKEKTVIIDPDLADRPTTLRNYR